MVLASLGSDKGIEDVVKNVEWRRVNIDFRGESFVSLSAAANLASSLLFRYWTAACRETKLNLEEMG